MEGIGNIIRMSKKVGFWWIEIYLKAEVDDVDTLTDKEIMKASSAIDKALLAINKSNRGEVAIRILTIVRNLNDNIAEKIWKDLYPDKPRSVNKVGKEFANIPSYRFIERFYRYLGKSVSHFTPTEDGAERLMLKYYQYMFRLKKVMKEKYDVDILQNLDLFLLNTDEKTQDYYNKVVEQIKLINNESIRSNPDNYYVNRIKPFVVDKEIYYEVSLEPAMGKPNKFNRITAFTKHDIFANYSVALKFVDTNIDVFGVDFPIRIISEWEVSIRPCEINNFAAILGISSNIQRGKVEYKVMMDYIKEYRVSLVDIIDYEEKQYEELKEMVVSATKNNYSYIFEILDRCRKYTIENLCGKNILRFLLNRMNNEIIKDQKPYKNGKTYAHLFLSSKCRPFDEKPFSFNPKDHVSNLYEIYECIDPNGHEGEIISRYIEENAYNNSKLFTSFSELEGIGDKDTIQTIVLQYNESLYCGFRPKSEIGIYKDYLYNKGQERDIVKIIKKLLNRTSICSPLANCFSKNLVEQLKYLSSEEKLDDPIKEQILIEMFSNTSVYFLYGAAGTGKTTLINHVSKLLAGKSRLYLAKTNPAVDNMRRKIRNNDEKGRFSTIDSFLCSSDYQNYDLVVVDECSTVKNKDILDVINSIGNSTLILVGDIYQIEAIGFGNWFNVCKIVIPEECKDELKIPHRSSDPDLIKLWEDVRNMSEDNVVLEECVRNDYSHNIDDDIFIKKSKDEIILCLNYNGLYGLNNINKLLQLNNPHKAVTLGIWSFKVGDPILFNDSHRFNILYNNLKGTIVDISEEKAYIYFTIQVEALFTEEDIRWESGLDYIENDGEKTIVGFKVFRTKPFQSDDDSSEKQHIVPFQVAYAVSIHKAQGLEYDSVKIVIADESEDRITHNIFYTAITRTRKNLMIYWSPEVCDRILKRIRPCDYGKDYNILKAKNNL